MYTKNVFFVSYQHTLLRLYNKFKLLNYKTVVESWPAELMLKKEDYTIVSCKNCGLSLYISSANIRFFDRYYCSFCKKFFCILMFTIGVKNE